MASVGQPGPYSVILWEWSNDIHMWEPYEPRVTDFIETKFQANPSATFSLGPMSPNLSLYEIVFSSANPQNAGSDC